MGNSSSGQQKSIEYSPSGNPRAPYEHPNLERAGTETHFQGRLGQSQTEERHQGHESSHPSVDGRKENGAILYSRGYSSLGKQQDHNKEFQTKQTKQRRGLGFSSKDSEEVRLATKSGKFTKNSSRSSPLNEKDLPPQPQDEESKIAEVSKERIPKTIAREENALREPEVPKAPPNTDVATPKIIEPQSWEVFLPQGSDDKTISNTVETLFYFVKQHISNFYINGDKRITQTASAALGLLHSPSADVSLEQLLAATPYQDVVLEHCINYLLLSGINFDMPHSFSLLPSEFTALPRAVRNSKAMGDRDPRGS
jgi:hypothetical protein